MRVDEWWAGGGDGSLIGIVRRHGLKVTEKAPRETNALPGYPGLTQTQSEYTVQAVANFLQSSLSV